MRIRTSLVVAGLAVLAVGLWLAVLFVPAGRLDWGRGWLFTGLLFVPSLVLLVLLHRRNPDLLRRRMSAGRETRAWDRMLAPLLKLGFTATIVVGAWEGGAPGRAAFGPLIWLPASVAFLLGYTLFIRSMLVNTHFESFVRIQHDRGHRVVDAGPYRVVRHPGYAGFMLQIAATPLVLGSPWALVPALAAVLVLGVRTLCEDRLLQRELPGYADYAARVRFRLVPGVF